MPWGEIGAVLVVLVIVFVVGNSWFHFVEAVWGQLKKWLSKNKKPTVWHTLPPEQQGESEHSKP